MPATTLCIDEVAALQCLLQDGLGMRTPTGPTVKGTILPDVIAKYAIDTLEFPEGEQDPFVAKINVLLGTELPGEHMDLSDLEVSALALLTLMVRGIPSVGLYAKSLERADVHELATVSLTQGCGRLFLPAPSQQQIEAWAWKVSLVLEHLKSVDGTIVRQMHAIHPGPAA